MRCGGLPPSRHMETVGETGGNAEREGKGKSEGEREREEGTEREEQIQT